MHWTNKLSSALARGARLLSPNCKEAARLQSEALDRKLPFLRQLGLRLHLLYCKWCRRYGRQISFLRSAAQESTAHDHASPPQSLSPEARERIKRRLESEKK